MANSGWAQPHLIAIGREVKYLFFLTLGFGEIISRPTNLHAIYGLSKIFSKMGRVACECLGKSFGVRLEKLRFGVIQKKVGPAI